MTNWFHRNPLKSTAKVTFDVGVVSQSLSARMICKETGARRATLLKVLADPSLSVESVLKIANQYLTLLLGFVLPFDNSEQNNLRSLFKFKWTETLSARGDEPFSCADTMFELCSVLFCIALWFTKHAAKVASQTDITEQEAKDVHLSLRHAAGIFALIKDRYVSELYIKPPPSADLHLDVLEAYISQCKAEAQEVTVARAIELKHDSHLICALAYETVKLYERSALALTTCDKQRSAKWKKYCEFKQACYACYANVYFAEELLAKERAGDAIAVAGEAFKLYEQAVKYGRDYGKADGAGISVKPADHSFFKRLPHLIEMTRRKCELDNNLTYHQKIPMSAPFLDTKAEYGLAEEKLPALDFSVDPRWNEARSGFDTSKILQSVLDREKSKDSKMKSELNPPIDVIEEKPIFSTDKEPTNASGCVLS